MYKKYIYLRNPTFNSSVGLTHALPDEVSRTCYVVALCNGISVHYGFMTLSDLHVSVLVCVLTSVRVVVVVVHKLKYCNVSQCYSHLHQARKSCLA